MNPKRKKPAAPPDETPLRDLRPFVDAHDGDAAMQVVRHSVLGVWEVVDNLTRLRPERTEHYHATIFGSARIRAGSKPYKDVQRLAHELAAMGCRIVTGGGPGLMAAANAGAQAAHPDNPDASVGIRIDLEHEQATNAFVGQAYQHRSFFSRLHHFMWLSNAFVVVPGGIGTLLELTMVWQLLQVRKLYGTPLLLVGDMWLDLVDWAARHMTRGKPQLADSVDMTIPTCVATVDDAAAIVREHYELWLRTEPPPRG
jgi:hypothetical protein